MSRISRKEYFNESNTFHVLVQGIAKNYIFNFEKDKSVYLSYLQDRSTKNNISILAYCIMGNHAHILVNCDLKENISKFFYEVNKSYAQYYNGNRRRVGYVFRNRYRMETIVGETYLVNCISYIHNNPVKAKMCETASQYEFSSAKSYDEKKGIVDFKKLKELIGGVPQLGEVEIDFIEDEFEGKLDLGEAIEQTMEELKIRNKEKITNENLVKFVTTLQSKTKVSLREIAEILEINREKLRTLMSSITSP